MSMVSYSVTLPMNTYLASALQQVQTHLRIANVHRVPRITQVVVNVGVGSNRQNAGWLSAVTSDLKLITGQAPQERRARQAVSGFGVRQGELVGYRITLRGRRMNDFVERFVKIVLPRVRDFRGVPRSSFDGRGNLSVGLNEQLAFPEIRADKTDIMFGLQVTFVTSAKDDKEGEAVFQALGFPLAA